MCGMGHSQSKRLRVEEKREREREREREKKKERKRERERERKREKERESERVSESVRKRFTRGREGRGSRGFRRKVQVQEFKKEG